MIEDVVRKLVKDHQYPFVGLKISKHFFERLCERFGGDVRLLAKAIRHCDQNICNLIYECYHSRHYRYECKGDHMLFVATLYPNTTICG